MLNFLIGILVGMLLMDFLWAWRLGTIDLLRIRFKLWNNRRKQKHSTVDSTDWMSDIKGKE